LNVAARDERVDVDARLNTYMSGIGVRGGGLAGLPPFCLSGKFFLLSGYRRCAKPLRSAFESARLARMRGCRQRRSAKPPFARQAACRLSFAAICR
jgi:hypothetical protein